MNCWLIPAAIEELVGLIAIEVNTGAVTVNAAELLRDPRVAIMLVVP